MLCPHALTPARGPDPLVDEGRREGRSLTRPGILFVMILETGPEEFLISDEHKHGAAFSRYVDRIKIMFA